MRYITDRPEMGQSPEEGFDCSGFVRFVLAQSGLFIPDYIGMDGVQRQIRHANEFWDHYGVLVGGQPEPGDLIFYSRKGIFPTHIGIVRDHESYIHSPGVNGATVRADEIVAGTIRNAPSERMLYTSNPIGFKAPTRPIDTSIYRYHQRLVE